MDFGVARSKAKLYVYVATVATYVHSYSRKASFLEEGEQEEDNLLIKSRSEMKHCWCWTKARLCFPGFSYSQFIFIMSIYSQTAILICKTNLKFVCLFSIYKT